MSKHILLGISGGIAAYKACELVRLLKKQGHEVSVAMSRAATEFVHPNTFQALSGNPVLVDTHGSGDGNGMAHINLTRAADVMLIAPATANTLAKIAHGVADNLLTNLAAARKCPLAVAPAMNVEMWFNPANQRNIAQLRQDGVHIFEPASGEQACGEIGEGRMLEPEALAELTEGLFVAKTLHGKRVVLTAGPTYEPIDPVRGITNISSGKMGYALARACRDAGAEVVLVTGPTALPLPIGVTCVPVQTACQMQAAVMENLAACEVFIAVAAVADYRIQATSTQKIKKTAGSPPTLSLTENPDILASVAALPQPPFCVGFAAESENLLDYAEAKRQRKQVPLLVANLAQHAMGADDNEIVLLDDHGRHPLPRMAKTAVAHAIVAHIAVQLAAAAVVK